MKRASLIAILAVGVLAYYARWFILTVCVLLAVALTGCATVDRPLKCAATGQALDGLTTGAGIASGLVEANPLGGAGALVAKPLILWAADSMAEPDRTETLHTVGAAGYGAAAYNACLLLGGTTPVCLLVGIPVMYLAYKNPCE